MDKVKLTKAQIEALVLVATAPLQGFPAGSNLWPLVAWDEGGKNIAGEVFDELLRGRLLVAVPRESVMKGQRSPNIDLAPDLDFEHDILITPAGLSALNTPPVGLGKMGGET